MDLKGSLVDTDLRIYPSEILLNFLKSIQIEEVPPLNILKILGKESPTKSKLNIDDKKRISVDLSDQDIVNLNKIRRAVLNSKTNSNDKPMCDSENEDNKENKNKNCEITNGDLKHKSTDKSSLEEVPESEQKSESSEQPYLTTADVDWLYSYLHKIRGTSSDIPYLHEIFTGSRVEMPKNKMIKRNPVLEARCVKLRAQQEAREYRQMTKGVDNVRMRFPEDSIAYQMKQINRQLIAILQFLISIFAGFLFGFKGLEWMIGDLDFGFRLLMGVMCALIIALAEIYFLAKKLNEELSVPETVQLGGPPKFVDESLNGYQLNPNKTTGASNKEHQD